MPIAAAMAIIAVIITRNRTWSAFLAVTGHPFLLVISSPHTGKYRAWVFGLV